MNTRCKIRDLRCITHDLPAIGPGGLHTLGRLHLDPSESEDDSLLEPEDELVRAGSGGVGRVRDQATRVQEWGQARAKLPEAPGGMSNST